MNEVSLADVVAHSYVDMDAPFAPTLRVNLRSYINDQFEIIGDPNRSSSDDEVLHAIQKLNSYIKLSRRVGDLEKTYINFMHKMREEALNIAAEIDNL